MPGLELRRSTRLLPLDGGREVQPTRPRHDAVFRQPPDLVRFQESVRREQMYQISVEFKASRRATLKSAAIRQIQQPRNGHRHNPPNGVHQSPDWIAATT